MTGADIARPRAVVFDVIGTLFDLTSVRQRFVELGAAPPALEAWFQRVLHEAAAVTLVGSYRPFKELAAAALRTTFAQLGLDVARTGPLDGLSELEPYPDAQAALARLREAGVTVATLSNGSRESTERLLEAGQLREDVCLVLSCDEVQAFKPHRAPYELALGRVGGAATMVAAHGWDVLGARAAGLDVVWIDREEHEWPFPHQEAPRAGDLTTAAELILAGVH